MAQAFRPWLVLGLLSLALQVQAAVFNDGSLQNLLDAGRADELERVARQRLQAQPEDAEATAALALAQLDLADTSQLRANAERLQACLSRHPREAVCPYALALNLAMQARSGSKFKALGLLGRVSELAQQAVALAPQAPEPRSALQQYYLALPGLVGGGETKARALEQGVTDADQLRLMRARLALSRKDWVALERELRAVRTQRPELLLELRVLWTDLGKEWMHQGQHAKAQSWLELLIKAQPQQAMGYYGLARLQDAMGQHDQAIASYERAKSLLGAEQLPLDHRQGIAWQAKGDKAQARAAFERYLQNRRASPSNVEDCRRRLAELGAAL